MPVEVQGTDVPVVETPEAEAPATIPVPPPVDPVRSAAGRMGAQRCLDLAGQDLWRCLSVLD